MTKRDVATIGCRLLAIYCVIAALGFPGTLINSAFAHITSGSTRPIVIEIGGRAFSSWPSIILLLAPSGFQLLFGVFLWIFADGIGELVAGGGASQQAAASWDVRDLKNVAVFIMGLYLLTDALPDMAKAMFYVYSVFLGPYARVSGGSAGWVGEMLVSVIPRMVIGIVLLISAHFMSRRAGAVSETHAANPEPSVEPSPAP